MFDSPWTERSLGVRFQEGESYTVIKTIALFDYFDPSLFEKLPAHFSHEPVAKYYLVEVLPCGPGAFDYFLLDYMGRSEADGPGPGHRPIADDVLEFDVAPGVGLFKFAPAGTKCSGGD